MKKAKAKAKAKPSEQAVLTDLVDRNLEHILEGLHAGEYVGEPALGQLETDLKKLHEIVRMGRKCVALEERSR
jgi:hypothetical protein